MSSSSTAATHDVFIGSACDGTRKSFVSHLSDAFKRLNITVIEEDDHNHLPESRNYFPKKTRLDIERCKICVVVLSENFAFCEYSLTTLEKVIERQESKTGAAVVPVFYGVDRSVVDQETGKFGEAFATHEKSDKLTEHCLIQWRNALKKVAHNKGLESSKESSDLDLVQDIVSYVYERLFPTDKIGIHSRVLEIEDFGINSRVAAIENLLNKQTRSVRSIGIWGMPGIGKTTIAKAAFDRMKGNYKSPRFISDFEIEFEKQGMNRLRRKSLPPYVKEKLDINRSITNQGQIFGDKSEVFLVLDDVRNPINAESFLGGFDWFDKGSVIIITSRDKQVLVQCRMAEYYEFNGLDDEESLKLFSLCTFGEPQLEEGYRKVSNMVVKYANGYPKALSYYGKELKDKKPEEMEIAFSQLKLNPPTEILEVFKNCYDGLSDEEKNIFLDIACFFKGDTIDRVMQVLDGCGFFPCIGINYLVEKSLVTICGNRVEMHNLIQDLGREILNQEVTGRRPCDITKPLLEDEETKTNEEDDASNKSTLDVGKEVLNQEVVGGMGRRLYDLKSIQPLLEDEETKPNGENYESSKCTLDVEDIESILLEASCLSFVVDPKAFQDMCNLRLLKIYSSDPKKRPGLDLCKGLLSLPYELRLLHWENYSLRTLPEDFDPDNLVELNMPYSQLMKLWEETKNLKSLKTISLHHSEKLVEIKELSKAHNLELIDLEGCTSLQSFPATKNLNHLQVLNLCGCTSITLFPEVPSNIKELSLKGTNISEIPASIETLSKLVKLDLGNCKKLLNFLVKIYNMESLESLNLSGCITLKSFPEIPKPVRILKYLYLSGTAIEELHTSLSNMIGLKELKVSKNHKAPFSLNDLKRKGLTVIEIDEEIDTHS